MPKTITKDSIHKLANDLCELKPPKGHEDFARNAWYDIDGHCGCPLTELAISKGLSRQEVENEALNSGYLNKIHMKVTEKLAEVYDLPTDPMENENFCDLDTYIGTESAYTIANSFWSRYDDSEHDVCFVATEMMRHYDWLFARNKETY